MTITYSTIEDLAESYIKAMKADNTNLWVKADIARKTAEIRKLKELSEQTGESYQTLKGLSSVAQQYEPANRIIDLPFEYYKTVAYREDRYHLLALAESENWSLALLRQKMDEGKVKLTKPERKTRAPVRVQPPKIQEILPDKKDILQYTKPEEETIGISDLILIGKWLILEKPWMWVQLTIPEFFSLLFMDRKKIFSWDPDKKEFIIEDGEYLGENHPMPSLDISKLERRES